MSGVPGSDLDRRACAWVRSRPHPRAVDVLAAGYSRAGDHARLPLLACATGLVLDRAQRGAWLRALAAVGAAEWTSQRVKGLVQRSRPSLPGLPPLAPTPSRYSFPSAHTATAVAWACSAPRARAASWLGAALVGLSRPYLGVHYPTDVLAGAVLGAAAGRALGQ